MLIKTIHSNILSYTALILHCLQLFLFYHRYQRRKIFLPSRGIVGLIFFHVGKFLTDYVHIRSIDFLFAIAIGTHPLLLGRKFSAPTTPHLAGENLTHTKPFIVISVIITTVCFQFLHYRM